MENWNAVSADVAAGLLQVGFAAVISRPGASTGPSWDQTPGAPVEYPVTVVDTKIRVKDAGGTLTGEMRRALLIGAGVVVPVKGDNITIRGVSHTVDEVMTVAPGGVDVLYRVLLER